MKTQYFKLLCTALLCMNLMQSPIKAIDNTLTETLFNHQLYQRTTLTTGAVTGILALIAAYNYTTATYLIQEKDLVKSKYPYAQAWYNDMAKKYSKAHLHQKLFLQRMHYVSPKHISWSSTFNQIYFPQDSLKDIDNLYRRKLSGEKLIDEEELTLSKEEFILLHEAAHIEHNDMSKRIGSNIGLILAMNFLQMFILQNLEFKNKEPRDLNKLDLIKDFDFLVTDSLLSITKIIALFCASIEIARCQESAADKFAYELGDINSLHGGVSFFENEEMDPLFDIQNTKWSPFLKVDSALGNTAQFLASCQEVPLFYIDKIIKTIYASTSTSRWMYNFFRDPIHPGPSVRAQNLKDEIAKREEQSKIEQD
ncbi:MAG: M48 family metalloprotease [Candidatus Dependentiae bacterium]|nr:M48 family metalloprotease [Candidatus Dependentiae bacterium]